VRLCAYRYALRTANDGTRVVGSKDQPARVARVTGVGSV